MEKSLIDHNGVLISILWATNVNSILPAVAM